MHVLQFNVRCQQHLMRSTGEGHQQEGPPCSSLSCSAACHLFVCSRDSNAEDRSFPRVLMNTKGRYARIPCPHIAITSVIGTGMRNIHHSVGGKISMILATQSVDITVSWLHHLILLGWHSCRASDGPDPGGSSAWPDRGESGRSLAGHHVDLV